MQKFPVGYLIGVVCSGVNGQEGVGWLSFGGAACVGVSPSRLCWVNGRDGNLQVMPLACLVRRVATPGKTHSVS